MEKTNNSGRPRILIVDDEEAICETLGDILQEKGFIVTIAGNGQEAINKAESAFVNIALIDINLPDMDGMALLKILKSESPQTSGIIITGNASLQNAISALEDGADGYFVKPLKIDEVLYKINGSLEKQKLFIMLEESEEKFRTLTEELSIGIMIVQDDTILYGNDALSKIIGVPCQELIDHPIALLLATIEREDVPRLIQQFHSSSILENDQTQGFYKLIQKEKAIWLEIFSRPIEYRGNQAISVAIVDISEKMDAEEKLKEANADLENKVQERTKELEEANHAKSTFLANMSHELRTPLNSIMGFSEALMNGFAGPLSDEQKDYINDIFESGDLLLSLINDVLDLSKIETGKMELICSKFDLKEVIEKSLNMFKEKLAKHQIEVNLKIDDDINLIYTDELKIKQILFNLLSNAIKFTPDGRNIGIIVEDSTNEILFTIWDEGFGISKENQARLFKPFERIETPETGSIQGTGLGLHYTKKVVELLGGRIWMKSELGQGSSFFFTIPKRIEHAQADFT